MKVPFIDLQRAHQPIKRALLDAFEKTIEHGGYCLGPDVTAFETAFAREQGVSRCVGVGSGTEALHLIACAMEIGPGDEVIIPSFTFIASAWFAQYVGARIVFADIDPVSYTLDPVALEALITDKTKAIVVTHLFGQAAALNVKLPALRSKTERRQELGRRYLDGIRHSDIELPQPLEWGRSVYHMFTIQHPERDRLRTYLADNGIGADIVYPHPLHRQPCFNFLGYEEGDFPVSERLANRCLSLPIVPELADEEIEYVIETLNAF